MSFLLEEPLYVSVNATANGDNEIIAAVAGRRVMVLGYMLTGTTTGTISIQDTAGSPVVHARIRIGTDGAGAAYSGPVPAFTTASGVGVEISNHTGNDTLGHMTYRLLS